MKILSIAALAASAAASSAQSELAGGLPPVRWLDASAPALHVVYDVAATRIRSITPLAPDRIELTTPPCFDNSEPTIPPQFMWYPYVVSDVGEELVAWGWKACQESSLLRSFTVRYGSGALPVSGGGPGAALSLALFQGTRGFGRPGTEIFRHTITGLPSGALVELTVDFGTDPVRLGDGNIGWSIYQIDGVTGPILVRAPKPVLGTVDALDLYSPGPADADTYAGTFNYGGCQGQPTAVCANLFLQLEEIPDDQVAASAVFNGTGVNPQLLSELFPARLGETWVARVDRSGQPQWSTTLLLVSSGTIAPIASPFGEVLVDPAQLFSPPLFGYGGYSFAVPADVTLAGVRLAVQGVVQPHDPLAPPPPFLTNALRVRLGY